MTVLLEEAQPGVVKLDDGTWQVNPSVLGPTWSKDPTWTGPRDERGFILPEITLGWQVLQWIRDNILADETGPDGERLPFMPTPEQARFIMWWYAVDETGTFIFREGVFQRLKGHGKDPLAHVLAWVELVGPCRFSGWATADRPAEKLFRGDPVGVPHPRAWVQVAAVSIEQTKNTMLLFPGSLKPQTVRENSIDFGKTLIYGHHGQRQIQAVTSSPRALEGGRPTFVIKNESHHWLSNNEGHAMADVIERNATKSKDGAARTLSITNAYEPSEDSVAQREREAWEDEQAGLSLSTGVLYDSLEAPPDAGMRPPRERNPDWDGRDKEEKFLKPTEDQIRDYLSAIIRAVRGDSIWLNIPRIVNSILDRKNAPSRSRRFYFNQVVAAEDAWVDPVAVDLAEHPTVKKWRISEHDVDTLRMGWDLVLPTDDVVMFFDGSKSDDATGIVGCRLSDGYIFTIGVWQKPPGKRGETWTVPRGEVSERVDEAMERFNVVAFWGDPSHALDDTDSSRYWDDVMDEWMRKYAPPAGAKKSDLPLIKEHWSVKSGHRTHAIMFDMTSAERQQIFIGAAETFVEQMETLNDVEEFEPQFFHDGHPALVSHLKNARRNPNTKWGVSLMKDGRESSHKIDLAVCAVGARMLARVVLNRGVEDEPAKDNTVWGAIR